MEEPKPRRRAHSKGFHDMLDAMADRRRGTRHTIAQPNSKKLLEISKQALKNGEIDIAETYVGKAIRKEKYEDDSRERNPEPYYYLAEVLQQKASKETVQLPQRQKFLLQAASLYNFVRNCLNKSTVESEFATNHKNVIPGKISDIQVSVILAAGGNHLRCGFNLESKKTAIEQLREESKRELEGINAKYDPQTGNEEDLQKTFIKQSADVRNLYRKIASKIKQLFAEIIQECLEVLGEPPCKYEVILLGSLAREETTPYSDLEWAILTSSDDEQSKIFFRNLTNLVHLQIINLGETILTGMDIEVLREEWFYDDVTPRGLSFDPLLPQASKTPLGNTEDFELIHTPSAMADFQSNFWYHKDPRLGEILLTVAPLDDKTHALLDEYNMELEKILREPCDLDSCAHDISSIRPTRGSCRGLCTLKEDISRYEPHTWGMFGIDYNEIYGNESHFMDMFLNYDGKLYDVKKEIYRLTDRVVAGLSKVFGVGDCGSFEALDKLCERSVISPGARDNLASAVAIALKMRLSTYLLAEKQEEAIKAKSNQIVATSNAYNIPREKELFHFFFVFTPLYELLCGFCDDVKNRSEDLARGMFFSFSDAIKGHMHCRLLNYKAASECYKRALEADPGNIGIKNRLNEIESMFKHSKDDAWDKSKWDGLTTLILYPWSVTASEDFYVSFERMDLSEGFAIIKNEGISVRAIIILNLVGGLLTVAGKTGEAYQCLQRAFIMEQTIFGDNPNYHAVVTLALLGGVCYGLNEWEEAKFCLERALKLLPSSENRDNFELVRSEIYSRLVISCAAMCNYEQAILYSQKGLDLSIASGGRLGTDCKFLSLMGTIWLRAGEDKKAWECALKANESLTNAVDFGGESGKAQETWWVALIYRALGKTDKAKLLFHRGLEEAQDNPKHKIVYLQYLAKLCWDQGLAEEAEQHYQAVLKILRSENKDKFDIISTLLDISKIAIENEKSSEAFRYLEEAAKYLSDLNDSDTKFKFLKKIAKRWECLEDYYQALMYLNKALEVCETSVSISKVEARHELIDLHIKLGDLVEKVSSISLSRAEESSTSNEQVKNDQRKHYDQAYDLLQRYLATGKLSCRSVDLLTDLAEKYTSIDLLKSEELLLKAMKINEETYGSGNTNEQAASILLTLGMVELKKENQVKALEFFHRSLTMELEMHASDPFHFHMYRNIWVLPHFIIFTEYLRWEELETMKQQVLKLWEQDNQEEVPTMSVPKACCLMLKAYVCVCSEDYEKAEELNRIAIDIFAKAKESCGLAIEKFCIKMCHLTNKTLDDLKRRQTQNNPVTRKKLLDFGKTVLSFILGNATSRLDKKIFSYFCNAFDDSENDICTFLSEETKDQDQESEKRLKTRFSRDENQEPENQDTESRKKRRRIDEKLSIESEYHNACLLAKSILCNSNHSYLRTKENSLLSLVKSLSESLSSCVDSFIKEAENARNKGNMYQMIVFLELASSQASVLESKAKISKLVGECQLYLQSYRMAAVSFSKAADFFRLVGSASELEHKVVYIESLIGLAKSCMLCNDIENALCACEEGLKIQSQLTTSQLLGKTAELLSVVVKCLPQQHTSSTSQENMGQCTERCKRFADLAATINVERNKVLEHDKLCFEWLLFAESTRFHCAQSEVERMKERQRMKTDIQELVNLYETRDVEISFKRRLYSSIGRVLVVIGETKDAEIPFTKSLAQYFVPAFAGTILPLDEIVPLLDAITATNAATSSAEESRSPFQQTLELCKDKFLKLNDNPFPLLNFFRNLGNHYVVGGQTEEAILAYEAGLAVAEHMMQAMDQINGRGEMLLHLANVHRLQAVENTGKGEEEERRLAEKYYKLENGNGTEKSTIHKNIMYANFLCDEGRYEEAIVVLNRAIEVGETLWSTNVICLYSQRVLYGSDIKKYIESHGELLTNMGNMAYTSLVRTYVQLGNEREASKALDRLLTNGKDLPPSLIYTTSCLPHLIGICQKYLLSLGKVMLEHQDKVDGAIACYERCVGLDPGDDTDQNLVATLADLYQTKAFTNGKDDYQKWMDKAEECFQKLLSKNIKMTPFLETTFASFLSRTENFVEAISHFEQVLASETNAAIVSNRVHIPLADVHMAREIESRGKVCLPLKINVYHQIVLGYLKCGKVEKAQESALQMEEYVENFSSSPDYSIFRSMLAYTYKEAGNERKAMEILKTVLETEPDNVPVKLALEELTTIEQTTSSCN